MKPFRLNRAQVRLLQAAEASPVPTTAVALCAAAGVSRATYYRWLQIPEFQQALTRALTHDLLFRTLPRVAGDRAHNHGYRAFKLAFDATFARSSQSLYAAYGHTPPAGAARPSGPTVLARHFGRLAARAGVTPPAMQPKHLPLEMRVFAASHRPNAVPPSTTLK